MEYRKLGKSDLTVSAVCLGTWSIVGEDFTWGHQELADSVAAIHASLDAGVNFFDTAELYGGGESEEILARALGARRKNVVVASKVASEHLDAEGLAAACENSLRRLKTDYIDLYQVHWPSQTIPMSDIMPRLLKLRDQGKVRHIGVSNFGPEFLADALAAGPVQSNQLPYNLLWRPIEFEVLPLCVEKQVSILCYSPLCQGLLTGKFSSADEVPETRARTRLFSSKRPHTRHAQPGCERETFEAIAEIRKICASIHVPMSHVALAWLLAQKPVASVVVGARNAQQAGENAKAADLKLPADVLEKLSAATERIKQAMGDNADFWQAKSRMEEESTR